MNVLDPQGPVAAAEKAILIDSLGIMLAIVLPTIVAIFAFAFWFRASNKRARYLPEFVYSGRIELVVWSIPALTVLLLGGVAWIGAHDLDPGKRLQSSEKPIEVEVVSLDWKWLFIYPDFNTATLNVLNIPAGAPVHFRLTSASVMNAFFIPQLGSMIYTMNGMANELNLQADKVGSLKGLSSHFSGDGFAGMHFDINVMSPSDFKAWTVSAVTSETHLNADVYSSITKQSMNEPQMTYRLDDVGLFDDIVSQKIAPGQGPLYGATSNSLPDGGGDVR